MGPNKVYNKLLKLRQEILNGVKLNEVKLCWAQGNQVHTQISILRSKRGSINIIFVDTNAIILQKFVRTQNGGYAKIEETIPKIYTINELVLVIKDYINNLKFVPLAKFDHTDELETQLLKLIQEKCINMDVDIDNGNIIYYGQVIKIICRINFNYTLNVIVSYSILKQPYVVAYKDTFIIEDPQFEPNVIVDKIVKCIAKAYEVNSIVANGTMEFSNMAKALFNTSTR